MNITRIVGGALIAAGILALVYGGFTYTEKTHKATIGPLDIAVNEERTVNVPVWAGVASVVVGSMVLLLGAGGVLLGAKRT